MSSESIPQRTLHLLRSPLFTTSVYSTDDHERALLSYKKARAIGLAYNMNMHDILSLSPKFWQLHNDPIALVDGAAMSLLSIQYNLCAGTIARYAAERPELVTLVEDLLQYSKHGQFMLTELGHGLDIANMETTATLQPSGDFILDSPTPASSKFMPPTVPAGLPCIAVVFAKLIVNGEDRGHRPFIVSLNDGEQMCAGVQSRLLPFRGGTHPMMHALTTFRSVRLPPDALLGSLEKPADGHANLMDVIHRVSIGTIALSCLTLPAMQATDTIGALYSLRRQVGSPGRRTPLLAFRTQHAPILAMAANAYVMQAMQRWAIAQFCDASLDKRVRHGIAAVFKSVAMQHSQQGVLAVSERCGAQGMFAHNQLSCFHSELRGLAIAEGDVLGLAIRLVNELLVGRYILPPSTNPGSLLAKHESGLFAQLREVACSLENHRGAEANRLILPRCLPMVEAIGHRMAYDAAVAQGVRLVLIDLYVANALNLDSAWYSEHVGVGRAEQLEMETRAQDAVLPMLGELIQEMDVLAYVNAPIVDDNQWNAFVDGLKVFEGDAQVDLRQGAREHGLQSQPMMLSHL
ncbi:acyl-CoA dehydrogenase NM domain-like protein [Trametes polyzona]|nr:acyl-CoA dehydrogenase NM domain-like protein [Trametes polyzona]